MTGRGESAVVLLSGGMDSLVTTAWAARNHDLALLHVSYGQRTADREKQAFLDIAAHYGVEQTLVLSIDHLRVIGGTSLIDRSIPLRTEGVQKDVIPTSYVPFRNAHLLSMAVSWAEVLGAGSVWIGAVEEDSSGYPDCSEAFFNAFGRAVGHGTAAGNIEIRIPLIHMSKSSIVTRGIELDAPFDLSWSCYQATESACGVCDSCRLRLNAFKDNNLDDPISYAINRI